MFYLDACVLVASATRETGTARVQHWLGRPNDDLAVSDWSLTEVASALSVKVRTGELSPQERAAAAAAIAVLVAGIHREPVERADFQEAARLAEQPDRGLRAGDALHLAICRRRGHTLVTLDSGLARAARAVKAAVVEP